MKLRIFNSDSTVLMVFSPSVSGCFRGISIEIGVFTLSHWVILLIAGMPICTPTLYNLTLLGWFLHIIAMVTYAYPLATRKSIEFDAAKRLVIAIGRLRRS